MTTTWGAANTVVGVQCEGNQAGVLQRRLSSELGADDALPVVVLSFTENSELVPEELASTTGASALLLVFCEEDALRGELRLQERSSGRRLQRRLRVSRRERDAVGVFALRAVELVRGARLELEQRASLDAKPSSVASAASPVVSTAPTAPVASARVASAPVASAPPQPTSAAPAAATGAVGAESVTPRQAFRFAAFGAVEEAKDGLGSSLAPGARLSWSFAAPWAVEVLAVGPFGATREQLEGTLQVTQAFAWMRLARTSRWPGGWALGVNGGVGGSWFSVASEPAPGFRGNQLRSLGLLMTLGMELSWSFRDHWFIFAEANGGDRVPIPRLKFDQSSSTPSSPFLGMAFLGAGVAL